LFNYLGFQFIEIPIRQDILHDEPRSSAMGVGEPRSSAMGVGEPSSFVKGRDEL